MLEKRGLLEQLPPPPEGKTGWPWTEEHLPDLNTALPKISIITPSYNQGQFIEETIRSILLQNYPNLEYIVVDGGSTDETVDILKKYDPWITSWVSEPDKGQSDALNKGMAKTTGEVFNWLNSDDYYFPGVLHKIGTSFMDPNTDIVGGRSYLMHPGKEYVNDGSYYSSESLARTVSFAMIDQPSTFFRLPKIKEIFPVSEKLHFCMDREMWIKFLLKFGQTGLTKIEDTLIHFRYHESSKSENLQPLFKRDNFSIFYQMAVFYGYGPIAELIKKSIETEFTPEYTFRFDSEIDSKRIGEVFSYFAFKNVRESYFGQKYGMLKAWSAQVSPESLTPSDRQEFRKIMSRTRIPFADKLYQQIRKLVK